MSERFKGIPASEGIAIERVVAFRHNSTDSVRSPSADLDPIIEMERFLSGRERAGASLERLASEAAEKFGEEKAGIFEGYREILMDDEIEEAVRALVDGGQDAEAAARNALEGIASDFDSMEGEYMRERAADIRDLGRRLADAIAGRAEAALPALNAPCVLAADDLSPAETVRLDLSMLRAIVIDGGGPTSHVAILAKSLGIPCVVGLGSVSASCRDGRTAAVDGEAGSVILDPQPSEIESFRRRAFDLEAASSRLDKAALLPAATEDGVVVQVRANIGSPGESEIARRKGADGVGLFRTEFLFMDGERLPSEDEQYAAYSRAAESLEGKPLTIRTLDIGGDKDIPSLGLTKEENPFLGYRAVRVGLDRLDILKPQLRAVLRAAVRGPIELMFPLVISVEEVRRLKALLDECRGELAAEGVATGKLSVGVMIETPAAALTAPELALEVDFFSIGTNDLTQYTLAVDRGNSRIAALYDAFHPAVLRLIAATCEAARAAGIPVGICGEFASDERAVPLLVGFGLSELSVSASRISAVKDLIRRLNAAACRDFSREVLRLGSVSDVRALVDSGAAPANPPREGRH